MQIGRQIERYGGARIAGREIGRRLRQYLSVLAARGDRDRCCVVGIGAHDRESIIFTAGLGRGQQVNRCLGIAKSTDVLKRAPVDFRAA